MMMNPAVLHGESSRAVSPGKEYRIVQNSAWYIRHYYYYYYYYYYFFYLELRILGAFRILNPSWGKAAA